MLKVNFLRNNKETIRELLNAESSSPLPTYNSVHASMYRERKKNWPGLSKRGNGAKTVGGTTDDGRQQLAINEGKMPDPVKVSQSEKSDDQKNKSRTKAIPTPSNVTKSPPIKNPPKPPDREKQTEPEPEIIPSIISQVVITEKMFNDLYKQVCESSHDVTVFLTPNLKLVIKKDVPDNRNNTPEPPMNSPSDLPSGSLLEPNIIIKEEIVEVEESSKYEDTCDLLHSTSTVALCSSETTERVFDFTKHSYTNETEQMEWSSNLLESGSSCSSDNIKETYNYSKQKSPDSSKKTDRTSSLLKPNASGSSERNECDFSFSKKYPPSSSEQDKTTYSSLLQPSCSYSSNQIKETSNFLRQNSQTSPEQTNLTSNLTIRSSDSSKQPEKASKFSKQNVGFFSEHNPLTVLEANSSYSREQRVRISSFPISNFASSSEQSRSTHNELNPHSSCSSAKSDWTCKSPNLYVPISSEQSGLTHTELNPHSFCSSAKSDWTCKSPKRYVPISSEQIERTSDSTTKS